ncbi:sensor histidine kinase [Kitasatospora sp. NPDC059673]|uniref:sensor histidine kinase n=1 Tax=Kitasatospora sp. NPDC059673 TaxID=3346901 RepID=UPI0036BB75C4
MTLRGELRRTAQALLGRAALRRWALLILGGAMMTPFWFVTNIVLGITLDRVVPQTSLGRALLVQFLAYLAALPLVAATAAALPFIRQLESAIVRTLLPAGTWAEGPDDRTASRGRTAAWAVLHLGLGAPLSGATLAIPPAVVALLAVRPFLDQAPGWLGAVPAWLGPAAGLLLAALMPTAAWATGLLLERSAPALLGPSAAEKLAEAERHSARLAERNRLARELHDSVGHALGVVTLQAAAAGRILDRDPAFARSALAAIEEAARSAADELDHVLGLLREESPGRTPQPDLRDVHHLADSARATGSPVTLTVGDLDPTPAVVSREAYRIVQEALTNALRHAAGSPVDVTIEATAGELRLRVSNPLPAPRRPTRRGGRGTRGIAERAQLVGGHAEFGPVGSHWQVTARLPLTLGGALGPARPAAQPPTAPEGTCEC